MDSQKPQNYLLKQTLNLPFKISKYQIIEELGRGGMGVVYKAFAQKTSRMVALKVLSGKVGDKEIKRFIREARAMAKMNHPNIVKIYDIEIGNDCPYFTMDYIEGSSLRTFLKNNSLDIRLLAKLMVKIGKAMTYAHQQGLIHRDLKPGNILLDKNCKPYIVDFGLAKLTSVDDGLSKTGAILGTPRYMSPQQARGEKVDQLTDVYALGAIFYEMLAKKPLIEGENIHHILFNVLHREPDVLRKINSKLSKDLEAICYKAATKETKKRYQNVQEFTKDIERFLEGEIIRAGAINIYFQTWNKLQKNKSVMLSIAASIFIVIIGVWLSEKHYNMKIYLLLTQAKKWQGQAKNLTAVEEQIVIYIKTSSLLEKALAISPNNPTVKRELIKTLEKIALLAKKQKNYLLSFALLQQCKRLGYKKSSRLLFALEQEKKRQKKKHAVFIAKIVKKTTPDTQNTLLNRYAFSIAKIQKPYTVKILVSFLISSVNKKQKLLLIKALGKLGDTHTKFKEKDSVQWLLDCLSSFKNKETIERNRQEVEEVIWALGWLKDARANQPVHKIRWLAGEDSLLWTKTKIPYKWIPLGSKILEKNDFLTKGNMKQEKGDYLGAIANYSKAIALNSRHSVAYSNRGNVYQYLGKHSKAIADYNKAIELAPNDFKVYNNRGFVYREIKAYKKAIADCNRAIALNPKDSGVYNNRGNVYRELKEYIKALADYNKAISLSPKNSGIYDNRGITYQHLKEHTKALADFNQAIALNPRSSEAYSNRGSTYQHLKEYTKAIADYSKAISLNPKNSGIYDNRGITYQYLKEHTKAIADYSKAISLNPDDFVAYGNRGYAYRDLKEYTKALADFSKAISLTPNNSELYNNRGYLYQHLKEYSKAVMDYSKAITLTPNDFLVYYNRGSVYKGLKKYSKAIADFSKAIALNPKYFAAYYNRGYSYLPLKKYQKAYEDFQIFLKLLPNHPIAPRIRSVIKHLKRNNLIK